MSSMQHHITAAVVTEGFGDDDQRAAAVIDRVKAAVRANFDGLDALDAEAIDRLLIGPIPAAVNGYATYVLLPDGSKRGWRTAVAYDAAREEFIRGFAEIGTVVGASNGDDGAFALTDRLAWRPAEDGSR